MRRHWVAYGVAMVVTAALTAAVVALLMNIRERKHEARQTYVQLVELSEETVDPAEWGRNFPREYDGYKRTVDTQRTRYGGSENVSKLDEDPVWRRIFAGYAFGVDYREERGHAYSLEDQKQTLRTKQFKQPGACLQCHAGGMRRVYETVGGGDVQTGFEKVNAMPLEDAWKHVEHPIACIDCHDPVTMQLRVTRPGFLNAIKLVKAAEGIPNYDPNTMATRQEMRTFVCGQCHVEYYFKGKEKLLTYPWHKGLKVEQIEAYYDEVGHTDWTHAETGAPVLKAQHPEFEMWSQGVHARSGVACADCHMPYKREGAAKVTDHHIRSPLLNVSRACLQCHHFSEAEMLARAEAIQGRTQDLLDRAETALVALLDALLAAKRRGATERNLAPARQLQRKAQFRLDFISAENSMGFHAPQEAARILAEAIDYARQGQLEAERIRE
ncbi:MAG: nitrite reductase [Omnitrophica WOR_2 bacterium RIFCSPLOWO2_02_FULL_63_16]|nr:MAG: nitrite reductase [Omnitrophica WOR_2 bacterium GWA2_63_20]OGX18447.1 MAG: nitrite reductase [Omnitrophica WOR_2 bacterium GWF2_63_9]OGX31594.1 MAG: nitrite reductase [Omnitrophica WOR_2 bacterium RIFCSPHIGHO2_12_FULL_64_13]OGX35761.1 MAG: nitrite reductase [Omnitrophica WOR_2 bacterium RIFCSPHIGHO2_02_FULL_63_39]OGX45747.1 MAG: nitrite reductase [Omnitrophica WOR_2 bacterium RIFCSPLOWO2_02_FULL_63_16]HBQ38437.1 ammonia-forming cytochrome c nitrite reductase subunit c552 [Candidatus Om